MANPYYGQTVIQITPMVKKLIIVNVVVWVLGVLIGQQFLMNQPHVFQYFGLMPGRFLFEFFLWQPFTYMFLHASGFFHILFNMLVLWMFGSELEGRWGGRFFLTYYLVCGVGAAFIYILCSLFYYLITADVGPLLVPVIGASGAVFGLLLAYGLLFGERVVLFMFLFPMKAKHFVILLGLIELVSLLGSGLHGEVSNLAHLGGLVAGFLFLYFYSRLKGLRVKIREHKRGRRLKLVVDNERNSPNGPRYWN